MKKLYAAVIIGSLSISIAAFHFHRTFTPSVSFHKWPYQKSMAFIVTCDDVSSGYPPEYSEEIQSLFEKYGLRATFFVIPYHGEWDLLTDSPQFVEALHKAEENGHEIALHGYAHYQDEFVCSREKQEELLEKALSIMRKAGLTVKGFRAPCLRTTSETLRILKEHDFVYDSSLFGESGDIIFEGELPQIPSGHEYTWYLTEEDFSRQLDVAKEECETQYEQGGVFSLVTHMKAVNEGEGMALLEQFLPYVTSKDVWNFTLIELLQWERALQSVTWESRKTLTGGDIVFSDIPEGLVIEVCLSSYYQLKNPPQGVEVTTRREGETCIFTITADNDFDSLQLSFSLSYVSDPDNQLLILSAHDPSAPYTVCNSDRNGLEKLLKAWEIDHRIVEIDSEISGDLLEESSIILIDTRFLRRPLTLKEKIALYSSDNKTIILYGDDLGILEIFMTPLRREDLDYIAEPCETGGSRYHRWLDLGYYRFKILKGRSTFIMVQKLKNDSPDGLYLNYLVRILFVSSEIPMRQPFFSLEIDDCGMYESVARDGNKIIADLQAYRNSLDLATSYNLRPLYGFTTSYFPYNPEIGQISSFIKKNHCLVAGHGYSHSLSSTDPRELCQEICTASNDIEKMFGSPPRVILVPAHTMYQKSMIQALKSTSIEFVGLQDRGYLFGVFERTFFYERSSLRLYSTSVDDSPSFLSSFVYSNAFLPSFYAETHIFNYIEKGAAYQYVNDALDYLVTIGYHPSDTETMAEEDFFWSYVDLISFKRGKTLVIELSGLENLPQKDYTAHFMIYGTTSFTVIAPQYCVESQVHHEDGITYVTLYLQPGAHTRR